MYEGEDDGNKEKFGLGERRVESTPCVDHSPSHSDDTEIPPEVVEVKSKDAKRKRNGTLAERLMREGKSCYELENVAFYRPDPEQEQSYGSADTQAPSTSERRDKVVRDGYIPCEGASDRNHEKQQAADPPPSGTNRISWAPSIDWMYFCSSGLRQFNYSSSTNLTPFWLSICLCRECFKGRVCNILLLDT